MKGVRDPLPLENRAIVALERQGTRTDLGVNPRCSYLCRSTREMIVAMQSAWPVVALIYFNLLDSDLIRGCPQRRCRSR